MRFKKGYHKAILSIFLIIFVSFLLMQLVFNHNEKTSVTGYVAKEQIKDDQTRPIQEIHQELVDHGWTRVASDENLRYTDNE
jgi:hypothetical protein